MEAAAEVLFGDAEAVVKVDCAEFQHSHEIAKLRLASRIPGPPRNAAHNHAGGAREALCGKSEGFTGLV